MNDFDAYKMYIALKRHFSSVSYDYIKYNGKIKANIDSFQKRKDKIFFQKLAKHPNLEGFLVSNFIVNDKLWIRDLAYSEECETIYKEWSKRQQTLTYLIQQNLSKLEEKFDHNFLVKPNEHPILLKLFLSHEISFETLCVLLEITNASKHWDSVLEYDPFWNEISTKIKKYTPFIKYDKDKIKKICLDKFS